MNAIIPAILPKDQADLEEKLGRFAALPGVVAVQVDVIDGKYASPASWPYPAGIPRALPYFERFRFDLDLMVQAPERVTAAWVAAGASRVTVHAESTTSLPRVLAGLGRESGHSPGFAPDLLAVGLAVGLGSDLLFLEPYLEQVDYVQLMGINTIGRQGEPFDPRVLKKVKTIRAKYPKMLIQVDGGVSLTSAPLLLAAGVDRLVVGSALLKAPDLAEEYAKFESLVARYGRYE